MHLPVEGLIIFPFGQAFDEKIFEKLKKKSNDTGKISNMDPSVQFRLAVFLLYYKGPVIWKHHTNAPEGIICPKPRNLNDPSQFVFPDPRTGKLNIDASVCDEYDYDGWGEVQCCFEMLAEDEWTCEPYKSK